MDDLRRGRGSRSSGEFNPQEVRSRSERVGPRSRTSRSTRSGGPGGGKRKKKGFASLFTWKWFVLVILTSVLLVVGGCTAIKLQGENVDLKKMKEFKVTSTIYDKEGNEVTQLGDYKREFAKIEDIKKVNPMLIEGFKKIEDERFDDHSGVDYWGLGRAVVKNILEGGKAEGASTITMQVAGNVVLENRTKTFSRKISEVATAWNLESKYSKDEIMETYVNYIYLGNGVAGVQMASKIYFGKDVTKDKLEPHEVAFIIGLPKAPSTYDPFGSEKKQKAAEKRRNVALFKMAEDNNMPPLITQQQKEEGQKKPVVPNGDTYLKEYGPTGDYAAYKELVLNELKKYGITESDMGKGYKIYTGLDPQLQKATEAALANKENFIGKKGNFEELMEAGTATIDVESGLIAAIGGGRDYRPGQMIKGGYEFRAPGSTIKPLTVYTPAMEKGKGEINRYSIVKDEPVNFNGWRPKNYDLSTHGAVPMEQMVKNSYNLSTAHMLKEKVGLGVAYNYAKKLGIHVVKEDENYPAMALGGLHEGTTPLQMARAYTALASNGDMINARAIKEVQDSKGEKVDEVGEIERTPVFGKEAAYWMTEMLKEVINDGTGKAAKIETSEVAGKTGTIQDYKAGWFAGYTPKYVTTVMVYNTDPGKGSDKGLVGGSYPAKIFKQIMDEGLKGREYAKFSKPPGVKDPKPPFMLESPRVKGDFDASQNAILLSWQNQDPRVKYKIYRAEQGGDFKEIAETSSAGYKDTDIEVPNLIDDITGFFTGDDKKKTYIYKVEAIDTQEEDEDLGRKMSDAVKVSIKGEKPKKDDEDPIDPTDPGEQPPGPGSGPDPECDQQMVKDWERYKKGKWHSPFPPPEPPAECLTR
ncbi:transglycosylase domain-containing protein [Hazenella coriacea]|uniref:Penicillin-binding protein 1A/penicillin-binding protein 2A n=1 Tax=Hazenella coriacea TaxID=1179467 RepID=A0A4R3L7I6_9BACL|nr:transglycosylase domain-containing protein [Hazenella coriacea]TCS95911.1 penicillin-binding protein 1A/penicillin-binding protein 2A [Hazenella coriacea]